MKTLSELINGITSAVPALFSLGALCVFLAACTSAGHHERRGTAVGAATGAVIGGIIGHQSGEDGEGAAIGAAAGALIGREIGRSKDESDYRTDSERRVDSAIDYGELMTEAEKDRVRNRAGKEVIFNWDDYLTPDEKRRLMDRAENSVGR